MKHLKIRLLATVIFTTFYYFFFRWWVDFKNLEAEQMLLIFGIWLIIILKINYTENE
jgi:hypothetical protein